MKVELSGDLAVIIILAVLVTLVTFIVQGILIYRYAKDLNNNKW